MSPTPREYNKMSEKAAPNSKLWKNVGMAFLVGGLICTIGQGILSWTQWLGLSQEEGGAVTSIALIFLSALLTGLYQMGVVVPAFFPRKGHQEPDWAVSVTDPGWRMVASLLVLCVLVLALGLGADWLYSVLTRVAAGLV